MPLNPSPILMKIKELSKEAGERVRMVLLLDFNTEINIQ